MIGFLKISDLSLTNMSSATEADLRTTFPSDWPEIEL